MSMTHEPAVLKSETLQQQFAQLQESIRQAAQQGRPIHEVERELWRRLRQMGHEALGLFLRLQGDGDRGETVTLPTGEVCQRLEKLHQRRYVSIFGEFRLSRAVYGSREKQQIAFVPLDNRLQLPASVFSYVLQDWDQSLCVEEAFGQASATMWRMLELKQSVDSLEHMNQEMAQGATTFMLNRPQPEQEGEIVVASADQKGIVLRRQDQRGQGEPEAHGHGGHRLHGGSLSAYARGGGGGAVPRRAGAEPGPTATARQGGVGQLAAGRAIGLGNQLGLRLDGR
jgi:hypothetical protein